jgi:hypothetical protein
MEKAGQLDADPAKIHMIVIIVKLIEQKCQSSARLQESLPMPRQEK